MQPENVVIWRKMCVNHVGMLKWVSKERKCEGEKMSHVPSQKELQVKNNTFQHKQPISYAK
jgi:hypothetical protein